MTLYGLLIAILVSLGLDPNVLDLTEVDKGNGIDPDG